MPFYCTRYETQPSLKDVHLIINEICYKKEMSTGKNWIAYVQKIKGSKA